MQSRFIKLTEYCLLEYQYESLSPSNPIIITSPFYTLKNGDNEIFMYNPDSALYETGNIKDLTVIPQATNGGRFVYLDSENSPNYTEYDENFYEIKVIILENNIPEKLNYLKFFSEKNYSYYDRVGMDEIYYNTKYFNF